MGKRSAVVIGAVVLALAIPAAVIALSTSSKLDTQAYVDLSNTLVTSSSTWHDIPDFGVLICAEGEVSATFSANLQGTGIGIRMKMDSGPTLSPGPAFFYPPAGKSASFSYQFAIEASTFEGLDGHHFEVQWRSLTGGSNVTMSKAGLNLQFQDGTSCGP